MQRRHRQLRGDLFLGSELFGEGEIRLDWKVCVETFINILLHRKNCYSMNRASVHTYVLVAFFFDIHQFNQ